MEALALVFAQFLGLAFFGGFVGGFVGLWTLFLLLVLRERFACQSCSAPDDAGPTWLPQQLS